MADYIIVGDRIYTFYDHARQRMEERGIRFAWVELALNEPDDVIEISLTRRGYDRGIEQDRAIRVVVDEDAAQIVTVFFIPNG